MRGKPKVYLIQKEQHPETLVASLRLETILHLSLLLASLSKLLMLTNSKLGHHTNLYKEGFFWGGKMAQSQHILRPKKNKVEITIYLDHRFFHVASIYMMGFQNNSTFLTDL
jgi:hypothetical protein